MLDSSAIQTIATLGEKAAGPQVVELDGVSFTNGTLRPVVHTLPEPAPLVVHTLSGFAGYIEANRDDLLLEDHVVHVVGPDRVELVSSIRGEAEQRFRYVAAQNLNRFAAVSSFGFGRWMDPEEMVIAVQSLFEPTSDRAAVLRVLGNIRDEELKTRTDDGVSQTVTVKMGALVDRADVPNPVALSPFRTFPDVGEQPASPFVFRLRKGQAGVQAALFEADGGAWQHQAIERVGAWLRERLPNMAVIA